MHSTHHIIFIILALATGCRAFSINNPAVLLGWNPRTTHLLRRTESGRAKCSSHTARWAKPKQELDQRRRALLVKRASQLVFIGLAISAVNVARSARAMNAKSRTEGYAVQKSDQEWKQQLSNMQYYILRQGGTENPFFSVLEKEKREGTFYCAGCQTPLFASSDKFNSGTGWPSFARALNGVETEAVNPVTGVLGGAELRCASCGGHLGDVFSDGYLFVGTEAFVTGKRYCIDGAALVFEPKTGSGFVRGDEPAKKKESPSWLDAPKIDPLDRFTS